MKGGIIMIINRESFTKLVTDNFKDNYHECAKTLNVDVSTVSRVINGNSKGGSKFFGSLMQYCNDNHLNFNEFIFLDSPLQKCSDGNNTE